MTKRILLSGAGGLIGRKLIVMLQQQGDTVSRLVRPASAPDPSTVAILWDPQQALLDGEQLEGYDAVIHLGGESLMAWRWSAAKKNHILNSRVQSTNFLACQLARLKKPPRIFLTASAVGYYGTRGNDRLAENCPPGNGFLSEVCQAWEAASEPAAAAGITVVRIRLGVVLAREGGVLRQLLPVYRSGLGGRLGSGKQYFSWIAINDVLGAIAHLIEQPPQTASTAVNLTSPAPVTNEQFNRILAHQLRRPAFFHLPAALLKMIFGQLADEMMLASTRAVPDYLQNHGYGFKFPELTTALQHLLSRSS